MAEIHERRFFLPCFSARELNLIHLVEGTSIKLRLKSIHNSGFSVLLRQNLEAKGPVSYWIRGEKRKAFPSN